LARKNGSCGLPIRQTPVWATSQSSWPNCGRRPLQAARGDCLSSPHDCPLTSRRISPRRRYHDVPLPVTHYRTGSESTLTGRLASRPFAA
jgi:hypothetical protein